MNSEESWNEHRGTHCRITRGETSHDGVPIGPAPSFAAADEHQDAKPLWRFQLDTGDTIRVHPDDWMIDPLEDGDTGSWKEPRL